MTRRSSTLQQRLSTMQLCTRVLYFMLALTALCSIAAGESSASVARRIRQISTTHDVAQESLSVRVAPFWLQLFSANPAIPANTPRWLAERGHGGRLSTPPCPPPHLRMRLET